MIQNISLNGLITGDNFVSKIKGRFSDELMYMIHANHSDKHQYDEKAVFSNFDKKIAANKIFLTENIKWMLA